MQISLLFATIALGAPALKDPPKKEINIAGEWIVESQTTGGQALKTTVERRYTFTADGKWSMSNNKAKAKAASITRTYAIDTKTTPASIDMKASAALAQPNMLGIIKVQGDTLTLCYSRNGEDRPTAFESPEDSTIILIVMKRAKPKD
jgi:uncharacterized protein (TIGR03067 family)